MNSCSPRCQKFLQRGKEPELVDRDRTNARSRATTTRGVIRMRLTDRVGRTDGAALCERADRAIARTRARLVECDAGALVDPDLGAVDALARLQLAVERAGARLVVRHAAPALTDLLELAGLRGVVQARPD